MKIKHVVASALFVSLGFAASAQAEDGLVDDRWYVAPYGTYVNGGGDRYADNAGYGAGLGIGKMINDHFNVEIRGFYNGMDNDFTDRLGITPNNFGQWDIAGGSVDLQYYFWRSTFSPYTVIGGGAMNSNFVGQSGVGILGEAGAGFTYEITDNLLFRSDVRYRYNNNFNAHLTGPGTDEYHDMLVNVGFVVPFGPKPVAAAPAAPDCSTMDSDSDGVNDCLDQCPGTITGSKVDDKGCAISVELKGVTFEYNSARLTPNATVVLDNVAESLVAYPQKDDIEVQGHTSSEGSAKYNQRLSEKRAQSVVDYLSMKGVTNRLTAHGFGEESPIADNSTEEGRMQNRRVELHWGAGAPTPVTPAP